MGNICCRQKIRKDRIKKPLLHHDDDEVLTLLSELISICRETNENTKKLLMTKSRDTIDPIEKSFMEEARRRLEYRMGNLANSGMPARCKGFSKALKQAEKDGLIHCGENSLRLTKKAMDKFQTVSNPWVVKQLEKEGMIQVDENSVRAAVGLPMDGSAMGPLPPPLV